MNLLTPSITTLLIQSPKPCTTHDSLKPQRFLPLWTIIVHGNQWVNLGVQRSVPVVSIRNRHPSRKMLLGTPQNWNAIPPPNLRFRPHLTRQLCSHLLPS